MKHLLEFEVYSLKAWVAKNSY